jgi:hypothetical protein
MLKAPAMHKMLYAIHGMLKHGKPFHNMCFYVIPVIAKMPNPSVKGMRRPQAVVNLCYFFGFVSFAKVLHPVRPLLLD